MRDRYRLLLLRAYLNVEYHLQYSFILYFHLNLSNTATLYQKQYNSQKKHSVWTNDHIFQNSIKEKKNSSIKLFRRSFLARLNRLERYCVQGVQASANILNSAMIRVFHERRLIRFLCRATMAEIIELQRGHHLIIYGSIHNVSFLTTTNSHLTATGLAL